MRAAFIALAACLLLVDAARAQAFATWLNARTDSLVALKLALRDPAGAVQIPARTSGEENLVERAGIPDISGIAISLPNAPTSRSTTSSSATSFTATPYMLLGLLGGRPLDTDFYFDHAWARRFGLSLTFDEDSAGRTITEVQGKLIVLDRPTALEVDRSRRIGTALSRAQRAYGSLTDTIVGLLHEHVGAQDGLTRIQLINVLQQDARMQSTLARAGPEVRAAIDRLIEQHITEFVALRAAVDSLVANTRSRPMLALGLTGSTAASLRRNVRAALILDVARPPYDLTANAIYHYGAASDTAAERSTLEGAAQAQLWLASPARLSGRSPPSITLAASAAYEFAGRGMIYKAQGRLLVPFADGASVPVSVTFASSTDLIDEQEVRAHVGFTLDLARLLDSAR